MSILGKIVGQLESGGSSGGSSLGLNYIKTERETVPPANNYGGGFVIAKLANDNKIYKFEIVATPINYDSTQGSVVASGFTFNKEVFLLYAKEYNTSLCRLERRGDNRLLLVMAGTGDITLQLEGYTTITQEEVVFEKPVADDYQKIPFSKSLASRIEALESA